MSSFSPLAPPGFRPILPPTGDNKPQDVSGKPPGKLQGVSVEIMPKPGGVKEPTSTSVRSEVPKPLEKRSVEKQDLPPYELRREARYGGVPDKDQLIAKAGRPKDDINFGIFGTKKMSTGYKAILGGLENYKKAFENDTFNQSNVKNGYGTSSSPLHRLQVLEEHLDGLSSSSEKYINARGHSHKDEIRALKADVQREKEVVTGLMDEISKGGKLPEGMELSEVVAFARQGISLRDMGGLHAMGVSPQGARDAIDAGLSPSQLKAYVDAGFKGEEAALLHKAGLGIAGGAMYREMHLAITPDTIVKGFKDGPSLKEPLAPLGSGAFNTVFTAKYQTSEGEFVGVFKPLAKPDPTRTTPVERGWVASRTGIDKFDPQIAMRNLATCDVAKELGFDVVPRTEIGIHKPPTGGEPQLGLVMEKAQGKPARQCGALLLDPDVRREVTKLQLLDHITGQGDRHGNNYFIQKDSNGKVRVTGIDNDQCFGKDLHDPNGIAQGKEPHNKGFRGTLMPPIVDTDMYEAVMSLTPDKLEATLKGKLTPEEIAAAKDRLQGVQQHMRALLITGMVIQPNEWNSELADDAFNERGRSYIERGG